MTSLVLLGAAVVSALVAWLVAWALRERCGKALRVVLGILAGFCCLFVFGVAAIVWMVSTTMKPPKPFDARTYRGRTGTVSLPYEGKVALHMFSRDESKNRFSRFEGNNGVVVVPAGNYTLYGYSVTVKDRNGRPVHVSGGWRTRALTIAPGGSQQIVAGPPFVASITVKQSGSSKVNMDLRITGSGNEAATIYGPSGKEPGFQVLSKSGEVLTTGSFRYG